MVTNDGAIVDMGAVFTCEPDRKNAVTGSLKRLSERTVLVAAEISAPVS